MNEGTHRERTRRIVPAVRPDSLTLPNDRSQAEDEQKSCLLNPHLAEGEVFWEARPPGSVSLDPVGAGDLPAARLERAPGPGAPVVWCQRVTGLPARRQVCLTARVRIAEGEAQPWARCYRADGGEIDGHHAWPWFVPRAAAAEGWQKLQFAFPVPLETHSVEVGAAIPYQGRAWCTDFSLRLVPEDEEILRAALVETLIRGGSMPTAACRRAFLRVPRHRFLPDSSLAEAYVEDAIVTRFADHEGRRVGISSSSQPSAMALMLGQLRLRPGLRVLEIGAGTGYNAAILAEIVGARNVVSIDLDREIAAEARARLDATGCHQVLVDVADGWDGYPPQAPYDRIIVTVGVHDLAPAWVEQLREGGVLVAPLSFRGAEFTPAFRKRGRRLVSARITGCGFMDLRGKQPRRTSHQTGDHLTVTHDALDTASLALLDEILNCRAEPFAAPELVDLVPAAHDFRAFMAFLGLAHPLAMRISDPRLRALGHQGTAAAIADLQRRQLAVAGINVCFGGPEAGEELCRLAREWVQMGRPGLDRLTMIAYPRAAYPRADLLPDARIKRGYGRWPGPVEKAHTWFQVSWSMR
jgi:protein-L-isoaspartate(D-aspartate) O-methyltransferase